MAPEAPHVGMADHFKDELLRYFVVIDGQGKSKEMVIDSKEGF